MEPQVWKLVQKRAYDLLSHRYGLVVILGGAIMITVSAFHFGEALLEWSHEKYATLFNSYSDNLVGRSFRERLCIPVPIDAVYTWVNGTDPQLILQLHKVKLSMEEQLNITRPGQCTFSNCVPAPVVVVEGLPYTGGNLQELRAAFALNGSYAFNYTSLTALGKADSLALVMPSWEKAKPLNGQKHHQAGVNYTLMQAFYTSDSTLPHGTAMSDKVLMTGFPHEYSSERVLNVLPDEHQKHIVNVEMHSDKGVAVLHMAGSKEAESILQLRNFTIEGKNPAFTVAYMVSDLTDLSRDGDVASSRFEDNEELRYSLRSLERFAPWIRHVYIVTNGQIPYWLNLDSPRISVITHEELFPNKSDLPTFSSPAIESHLHRITGLSDKFLYFNDDVMFGSEVWPDDFFTYATGQKLYLTWPVPSCNEGCPSNWIHDGYCDKACNSSECEWDGGDCSGVNGQVQLGAGFQAAFGPQAQGADDYCNPGCANNWIADKYCDQACNHLPCAFDAGDCGTSNYDQLIGLQLHKESATHQNYTVPEGETLAFFNLTEVLGPDGKMTSASHHYSAAVRAAAVSNKYRVLTLLLYPEHNATTITFHLQGYRSTEQDKFELNFTVSVDTSAKSIAKRTAEKDKASGKSDAAEMDEETVLFEEYARKALKPHVETGVFKDSVPGLVHFPFNITSNLTLLGLSPALQQSLSQLVADNADGDFTEEGFRIALADLYKRFHPEIRAWKPSMKTAIMPDKADNAQSLTKNGSQNLDVAGQPKVPQSSLRKLLASDDVGREHKFKDGQNMVKITVLDSGGEDEENGGGKSAMMRTAKMEELEEGGEDERNGGGKSAMARTAKMAVLEEGGEDERNGGGKSVMAKMAVLEEGGEDERNGGGKSVMARTVKMAVLEEEREEERVGGDKSLMTDEEFLEFLKTRGGEQRLQKGGQLPWEMQGVFRELRKRQRELQQAKVYEIDNQKGRQLLDTFGESLRHVNRLYNKLFGLASRRVPAHMPHMIDKHIMAELQAIFPVEWAVTSAHKVRSPDDMQFAFSYYYYILGAAIPVDVAQIFDEMDTDHSGILSDRELRTLATRMNELPLYLETLTGMESMFVNCSKSLPPELEQKYSQQVLALPNEQYYEQQMPQVTKLLFTNCPALVRQVKETFKSRPKYRTTTMDDSDVAFKMIHGNVSKVVGQLDDIRKNPKKFICLNDNIDHGTEEAKTVKAVVQDFYESLLPIPSQFELPREYRNRFLHMRDLEEWRRYRDWLRFWAHLALIVLVLFTIASYFGDKIEALQRRLSRQRQKSDSSTSLSPAEPEESPAPAKSPPLLPV